MTQNTKIEWAHHTFSPWLGCTAVSAGCDHCYAEAWARRTGRPELWDGERKRTTAEYWRQPLKWDRRALMEGRRYRVFPSMCDPFDNQADPGWRADFWQLVGKTPHLDWLLLTKRPQNIAKMLPVMDSRLPGHLPWNEPWPWPNVWLGMTAEDEHQYNLRWPYLSAVPAAMRFVSYEPALGPLNYVIEEHRAKPDWLICGGESGPKARPMHPGWARAVRDQCSDHGIAFFFKQWGEWGSGMTKVGKKVAGRVLDGAEHDAFPLPRTMEGENAQAQERADGDGAA